MLYAWKTMSGSIMIKGIVINMNNPVVIPNRKEFLSKEAYT